MGCRNDLSYAPERSCEAWQVQYCRRQGIKLGNKLVTPAMQGFYVPSAVRSKSLYHRKVMKRLFKSRSLSFGA